MYAAFEVALIFPLAMILASAIALAISAPKNITNALFMFLLLMAVGWLSTVAFQKENSPICRVKNIGMETKKPNP